MSTAYLIRDQFAVHFITFAIDIIGKITFQ